ncbi:MAG TPA: DUF4974 domain-containing protein [Bacteroidetes bacterium]|nr:DUF4974 domain-containing protein [Bacteroidota bacterium]
MNKEHYILLLQKQLSGGISPQEESSLRDWLAASEGNRKIGKSIQKAWELSEGFSQDVELDLDADFLLLEKKIAADEEGKNRPAKVRRLQRRWILRIAAVFVLLAAGPYILKKYLTPAVKYQATSTGDEPSTKAIELLDGSKVWLNKNTKFSYFTTSVSKERRVKIEGEAFFEVAKDASKPFVVETPSGEVTVLGTSFSVEERKDNIEVIVATGIVKLSPKGSDSFIKLRKQEKGVYDKKKNELIKKTSSPSELAWHTKKLVFENTPLKEVLETVGQFYEVNIVLENKKMEACPVSAVFDNKPLATVLQTLSVLFKAEAVKAGQNKYLFKGGSCN